MCYNSGSACQVSYSMELLEDFGLRTECRQEYGEERLTLESKDSEKPGIVKLSYPSGCVCYRY